MKALCLIKHSMLNFRINQIQYFCQGVVYRNYFELKALSSLYHFRIHVINSLGRFYGEKAHF